MRLKHIFSTLKFVKRAWFTYISKRQSDFANSWGSYMRSFAKINPPRKLRINGLHNTFQILIFNVVLEDWKSGHTFACNWHKHFLESAEGMRMTLENISWSISTKVWDQAWFKLATPGSTMGLATDCATRPSAFKERLYAYTISTEITLARNYNASLKLSKT